MVQIYVDNPYCLSSYENQDLFQLLKYGNVVDWGYDENNKIYNITDTGEYNRNKKFTYIGKHFKFVNNVQKKLYKYHFLQYDIEYNINYIIDDEFICIKKFITQNNITTVNLRLSNVISVSEFEDKTTKFFMDKIEYKSKMIECLLLLSLIKMMFYDDIDNSLTIEYHDLKNMLAIFNDHDIDFYKIKSLIDNKLIDINIINNRLMGNKIIKSTNIHLFKSLFEYKFILAIKTLMEGYLTPDIKDCLKGD